MIDTLNFKINKLDRNRILLFSISLLTASQFLASNPFAKIAFLSSLFGVGLLFLYIITGKYSFELWFILSLLLLLGSILVITSTRRGFLVSILMIFALKNIDINRVIKTMLNTGIACLTISVLLNISMNGFNSSELVIRSFGSFNFTVMKESYGYSHANMLFLNVFILNLMFFYLNYHSINYKKILLSIISITFTFYFTFARTGLLVYIFSIFVLILLKSKFSKSRNVRIFIKYFPFLIIIISFVLPYIYMNFNFEFINKIDISLSNRLYYSGEGLEILPFTFWGMDIKGTIGRPGFPLTIDNSFVLILRSYGFIAFTVILIFTYYIFKNRFTDEVNLVILVIYLYCFTEAFFPIATVNFSLLLVGHCFINKFGFSNQYTIFEFFRRFYYGTQK